MRRTPSLPAVRRAAAHRARRFLARLGVPSDRDLVISYLFPPAAETAGLVMAKRLQNWPRNVDVIANEAPRNRAEDPGGLKVAGPRVKRISRVTGRRNQLKNWALVEKFCDQGAARIRSFERSRGPYRRVYSRAMMPASHFLAATYKLRRPSTRWTAEFSDPMLFDTHGIRRETDVGSSPLARDIADAITGRGYTLTDPRNMFELCEAVAFALADELVFTNEVQRDFMLDHTADPHLRAAAAAKSTVRPHPSPAPELYDAVEPPLALSPELVHVAYFGAFYLRRGLDDLLRPFALLTNDERTRLRLHVFTDKPDAARTLVDHEGLADCVMVHAYVPFLEFLALTKRVDRLVLADARVAENHQVNPYLPSKLSDYRGSGTPVWALVEDGSPLSAASEVTATPLDDVDSQVRYLRSLLA